MIFNFLWCFFLLWSSFIKKDFNFGWFLKSFFLLIFLFNLLTHINAIILEFEKFIISTTRSFKWCGQNGRYHFRRHFTSHIWLKCQKVSFFKPKSICQWSFFEKLPISDLLNFLSKAQWVDWEVVAC